MAEDLRQLLVKNNLLKGNERIWGMHKAIPNDYRFIWLDNDSRVLITKT